MWHSEMKFEGGSTNKEIGEKDKEKTKEIFPLHSEKILEGESTEHFFHSITSVKAVNSLP